MMAKAAMSGRDTYVGGRMTYLLYRTHQEELIASSIPQRQLHAVPYDE